MRICTPALFVICISVLLCLGGCDTKTEVAKRLESVPDLVAYWDFADENYLVAKGITSPALRAECDAMPTLIEEGPLSGRSLHFDGNDFLYIPYAETGALNVKSGSVTVVAW